MIETKNLQLGNIAKTKDLGVITIGALTKHLASSEEFGEWIKISDIEPLEINETRLRGFKDFYFTETFRSLIVMQLIDNQKVIPNIYVGFSDEVNITYLIISKDLKDENNVVVLIGLPHIKFIHQLQQLIDIFSESK